ncbi:Protein Y59E9AL.4 [Aphelenchoides avenae]|nr:Protein Y59E9AL.4 [Aphelenchus avenae]
MQSSDTEIPTKLGGVATSLPTIPPLVLDEKADKGDTRSVTVSSSEGTEDSDAVTHELAYRATDVPPWKSAWFFAFQQCMVCISGVLVMPFIIANLSCAGSATIAIRVKLISTTLVITGISTLLQTTLGLRLAILQGPSFAFLQPILAFTDLPEMKCHATLNDYVPEEDYMARIQTIQGSLAGAAVMLMLIGGTGFVGVIAKYIGPITVMPLLMLLCLGNIPVFIEDAQKHWISLVNFGLILSFALFFAEVNIPFPYFTRKGLRFTRFRLLGQFPYLLSIVLTWMLAFVLGKTGLEPEEGEARVDKNLTMSVLRESPWFQVPYPAQFGAPSFSVGLFLGFLASCVACCVESLGAYGILAKVSQERPPPALTLNRAVMIEGFGAFLAGLTGCCIGITTYSENVAVVSITRVASRFTMQLAGVLLILLGMFTKVGAVMATIPDACVGGILAMGVCMIAGVSLSNLPSVDPKLSRNLTIMGLAVILGMAIPDYFSKHPIVTGVAELDQMFNILLNIRMFVGGVIAFVLDNTVTGATYEQRGLHIGKTGSSSFDDCGTHLDGYSYPYCVNK